MKRLVLIVCFVLISFCTAQLNFSPGWGKRAMSQSVNSGSGSDSTCKTSVESLMLIYKLIQVKTNNLSCIIYSVIIALQNEAQKLVECIKLPN